MVNERISQATGKPQYYRDYLYIRLRAGSEDALARFPYRQNSELFGGGDLQYIEREIVDPTDGTIIVAIYLSHGHSTDIAQEMFLNGNPAVIRYNVLQYDPHAFADEAQMAASLKRFV